MTKVVVITGGSSGIGLCAARALLEKGCRVYELSRRAQGADAAITHVQADVTDEAQVRAAVAEIVRREGRIDVLIRTPKYVYIIELKRDSSPEAALAQINSKHYESPFRADSRAIVKIGVNFSTATRNLTAWLIES